MNALLLLVLVFFIPLVLLLGKLTSSPNHVSITDSVVYCALSSCLGDALRQRAQQRTSFGKGYALNLSSGAGQAGWEQIEMEGILNTESDHER